MRFFSKKKTYSMDVEQAASTLSNVYSACDIKVLVQKASIKDIQKKHKKEARNYRIILISILVFLFATILLPLSFKKSLVSLKVTERTPSRLCVLQHHYEEEEGLFYLTLSGDHIDYENIRMIDSEGSTVLPTDFDVESSTLIFPYHFEELNLYIPDKNGSFLQLLLSPK